MEIEIKATYEDREKVKNALKMLGAQEQKVKHQIDDYYNHPSRDTRKTNEYIRLRYKPGDTKGVFAHHINIADGVNKEFETEVGDIIVFKQILSNFGFELLGTIDKRREVYELEEFSISLDDVKNVGNFIEIETEGEESEMNEKRESCIKMLKKIGLSEKNICKNVWLCDIATGRMKWPQE